jgi:hypothetical protein
MSSAKCDHCGGIYTDDEEDNNALDIEGYPYDYIVCDKCHGIVEKMLVPLIEEEEENEEEIEPDPSSYRWYPTKEFLNYQLERLAKRRKEIDKKEALLKDLKIATKKRKREEKTAEINERTKRGELVPLSEYFSSDEDH